MPENFDLKNLNETEQFNKKAEQHVVNHEFRFAAEEFEKAKEYKKAAFYYSELEDFQNCARCFKEAGLFKQAGEYYEKADLVFNAIECYDLASCFLRAAELSLHVMDYEKSGECFAKDGKFNDAFKAYIKAGNYNKVVESCIEAMTNPMDGEIHAELDYEAYSAAVYYSWKFNVSDTRWIFGFDDNIDSYILNNEERLFAELEKFCREYENNSIKENAQK